MHLSVRQPLGNILEKASLAYIFTPYFIFAFGWLKFYYAVIFCTIIATALFLASHKSSKYSMNEEVKVISVDLLELSLILVVVLLWVGLSGIGGYGFQNEPDYSKHNAILKDLIFSPWPVAYNGSIPGIDLVFQVYYIAFYLPAALVGKLLGWNVANHSLFVWSLLGVVLSVTWFSKLVKKQSLFIVLLFIMFGGMDFLGHLLLSRSHYGIADHEEAWAGIWQYSSNTTLLFWVPQHAFPGWILTAMIIYEISKKSNTNLGFILAGSALWSPFVLIGLIPFFAVGLYCTQFKKVLSFQNLIAAPIIILVVGLFYISKQEKPPHGLIWNFTNILPQKLIILLLVFYTLEFGVYALLCFNDLSQIFNKGKTVFLTALASLIFFPLYKVGINNDFVMRASIPSLFVLWVVIAINLINKKSRFGSKGLKLLTVLLIVGACPASSEIARSIQHFSVKVPSLERTAGIPQLCEKFAYGELSERNQYLYMLQYLGKPNSFFFKYLAPPYTALTKAKLDK